MRSLWRRAALAALLGCGTWAGLARAQEPGPPFTPGPAPLPPGVPVVGPPTPALLPGTAVLPPGGPGAVYPPTFPAPHWHGYQPPPEGPPKMHPGAAGRCGGGDSPARPLQLPLRVGPTKRRRGPPAAPALGAGEHEDTALFPPPGAAKSGVLVLRVGAARRARCQGPPRRVESKS